MSATRQGARGGCRPRRPSTTPEPLVAQEMERRLHDLASPPRAAGRHHPAVPRGHRPGSRGVRRRAARRARPRRCCADLALRAVVAQEAIDASRRPRSTQEIERLAERMEIEAGRRCARDLEQRGAVEAVRSDLARGKALQFLIDHADRGRRLEATRSISTCPSRRPRPSSTPDADPRSNEPPESDEEHKQ